MNSFVHKYENIKLSNYRGIKIPLLKKDRKVNINHDSSSDTTVI